MKILLAYGIPQNIVKLIEAMYKDNLARVITENGLTEAFYILADDLALTTDTAAEAQDLLHSVELAANSIGLHLNESKTEYIRVNLSDDDSTIIKAVSGEELEKVDDFVYLGSRIMRTERDFEVRKGKAWGACHQLIDIWKSGMRGDMKIRLFRAAVESVLLYGSETWTIGHFLGKVHQWLLQQNA
ncbi:hypothetical protein ACHWQZ_G003057 [Mnemiopsis leidyi]